MISRPASDPPSPPNAGQNEARQGGSDEAADYIAQAVADLAAMARHHGMDTLGFLLEMAQIEADQIRLRKMRALK